MAYRNKTYVCFDGDEDMHYYRLMCAWSENEKFEFSFHNAHDLNTARDTSQEESIKRQLRERFANYDPFHDILTLDLTGDVHWPDEWKGTKVECYLRGDRSIQTTMTLGKPGPGRFYPSDHYSHRTADIGYIHSVPRTTKPKRLVFEANLPKDMFLETAHLIRLEVWRCRFTSRRSRRQPIQRRDGLRR